MWNHSKSLLLTAWWIRIALVAWIVIAVVLPFLQLDSAVLVLFYLIFVPVLLALYGLARMLGNIQQGKVFSSANTACLRLVSWACFFAAVFDGHNTGGFDILSAELNVFLRIFIRNVGYF